MPRPRQWFDKIDPLTADFTYVRWLGDRKEIEAKKVSGGTATAAAATPMPKTQQGELFK